MRLLEARSPLAITLSVWRAIFLREALDRLFKERAAWVWLLVEPVMHIAFFVWVFAVVRARNIGGIDTSVWIMVGMLSFFLFRRTAIQVMHAPSSNKAFFSYRQVKPFDTALMRGVMEGFLMIMMSVIVLFIANLLGIPTIPGDPLLVIVTCGVLWLYGLGYGLVASVLMELVPELEHVLQILMLPLYLISGVIVPISSIPYPYQDYMMINPIAHGLELVRQGFAPHYHTASGTSLGYILAFAMTHVFLGLLLYRRFALRLVMR
ncbi:MAG: ABC transporter permease [Gammaproteobacteria bacterium]|nr:ABC transporter permease [Gammaproteobacteria bacterium]